jgi:phosphoglycerol transferase
VRTLVQRWFPVLLPWIVPGIFIGSFFAPILRQIHQPFWDVTGGDALFYASTIKSLIETGWVWQAPQLGAPFGSNFADFPGADDAFMLLLKTLALFSSSPTVVMNLFYVGGYLLVYATAYWALRRFGIGSLWAATVALIYACAPYHFMRGLVHLNLSCYFVVPLWVWLSVEMYLRADPGRRDAILRPWWFYGLLLVVMSSGGIYYDFFGLLIVTLAGILGAVENRSLAVLRHWFQAIAVVLATILVNIGPSLVYWYVHGTNPAVATRQPLESELYGFRIGQLLMPLYQHHVHWVAQWASHYHDAVTVSAESTSSALGVVAALGFLLLLAAVFFGGRLSRDARVLLLSKLNLALLLFSVVGGFAMVFAMLVTPQFRGTSRASIFVAFLSLAGLALWLQEKRPLAACGRLAGNAWIQHVLALLIMVLAMIDQAPIGARAAAGNILDIRAGNIDTASEFQKDSDFKQYIAQIENRVSRGAMIYVMPYVSFPEAPQAFQEGYNAFLRPYVYSAHLRWSYGAMRGRLGDIWVRQVEALPMPERLAALRKTGFEGIFIDRKAYRDNAAQITAELTPLVDGPALESADHRYIFFPLRPAPDPSITPALASDIGLGFYPCEHDQSGQWCWSQQHSEYQIYNFTSKPVQVTLGGLLQGIDDHDRQVAIQAGAASSRLTLTGGKAMRFSLNATLVPGLNRIRFDADAAGIRPPGESRVLDFSLILPLSIDVRQN